MPRAFFFPHGLHANQQPEGLPGRVPFDVRGAIVSPTGTREGNARVYADGYDINTVGTNQDPCIFSSPLGPFHAFCKIDGRRGDLYVKERGERHERLLCKAIIELSGEVAVPPLRPALAPLRWDPMAGRLAH